MFISKFVYDSKVGSFALTRNARDVTFCEVLKMWQSSGVELSQSWDTRPKTVTARLRPRPKQWTYWLETFSRWDGISSIPGCKIRPHGYVKMSQEMN